MTTSKQVNQDGRIQDQYIKINVLCTNSEQSVNNYEIIQLIGSQKTTYVGINLTKYMQILYIENRKPC